MDIEERSLKFRIYRRNSNNIIILWNAEQLGDPKVSLIEPEKRSLKFKPFIPFKEKKFEGSVVGVIINHKENELDPLEEYKIQIDIPDKKAVLRVDPFEDKQIQLNLHAFCEKEKKWKPVSLVETDIGNAILVKEVQPR